MGAMKTLFTSISNVQRPSPSTFDVQAPSSIDHCSLITRHSSSSHFSLGTSHSALLPRLLFLSVFQLFSLPAFLFAIEPSRYAGDNPDAYLATIEAVFTAKNRPTDPFGQLQDPDARPAPPKPTAAARPAAPSIPLAEIVGHIQINTIMPREKRFLIGARAISEGEILPVTYRGEVHQIEITEVSAARILFRNIGTGETFARELSLLPPGMTPGNASPTPPGMVPASGSAPLILDSPASQR